MIREQTITGSNPQALLLASFPSESVLRVAVENNLIEPESLELWNELAAKSETCTISQTFEWNHHWWNWLRGERTLRIISVWRGDRRIAIIPMMESDIRLCFRRFRYWEFLTTRQGDYLDFICAEENKRDVVRAFLDYIGDGRAEWDLIHFKQIPDYSSTLPGLYDCARARSFYSVLSLSALCPTYCCDGNPAQDRKFINRKSLRSSLNGLRRLGSVQFVCFDDPAEVCVHLENFFEMHVRRRALTSCKSSFEREANRNFYRHVSPDLAGRGWLRLFALKLNGEVIAYEYSFVHNNVFTMYKPAYSLEYSRHSPGNILTKFEFEWAADRRLREIDMTVGDEPYKSRFSNHTRRNHEVLIAHSFCCYAALRIDRWLLARTQSMRERLSQSRAGEMLRSLYRRWKMSNV